MSISRSLLFILILACSVKVQSQSVFSPPGAEWRYSFYNWPFRFDNYKIKYEKDTIVGLEKLKLLTATALFRSINFCGYTPSRFRVLVKQNGDTVFFKHKFTPGWQILYNFATGVNQFWKTQIIDENNDTTSYYFQVDSITTISQNGYQLKKMVGKMLRPNNTETITIVERYGNMGYLFNFDNYRCASDGDMLSAYLCYKDSTFGTKQFTSLPCDYVDHVSIKDLNNIETPFHLFPNPATNKIHLSYAGPDRSGLRVVITDMTGRTVLVEPLNSSSMIIDISRLRAGLYLLSVTVEAGMIENKKLMIAR